MIRGLIIIGGLIAMTISAWKTLPKGSVERKIFLFSIIGAPIAYFAISYYYVGFEGIEIGPAFFIVICIGAIFSFVKVKRKKTD